jgi:hypothetical protein
MNRPDHEVVAFEVTNQKLSPCSGLQDLAAQLIETARLIGRRDAVRSLRPDADPLTVEERLRVGDHRGADGGLIAPVRHFGQLVWKAPEQRAVASEDVFSIEQLSFDVRPSLVERRPGLLNRCRFLLQLLDFGIELLDGPVSTDNLIRAGLSGEIG